MYRWAACSAGRRLFFSYPFELSLQPACTLPCGRTQAGLPIGLQFVGPLFGDVLALRAARAYEMIRGRLRSRRCGSDADSRSWVGVGGGRRRCAGFRRRMSNLRGRPV